MIVRCPRANQPLLADSDIRVYQTLSIGLSFYALSRGNGSIAQRLWSSLALNRDYTQNPRPPLGPSVLLRQQVTGTAEPWSIAEPIRKRGISLRLSIVSVSPTRYRAE